MRLISSMGARARPCVTPARTYRYIAQLVCLADASGAASQLPEHVRDQLVPRSTRSGFWWRVPG